MIALRTSLPLAADGVAMAVPDGPPSVAADRPAPEPPASDPLSRFVGDPLFGGPAGWFVEDNPFRRPSRPQDRPAVDLSAPLTADRLCAPEALWAGRVLATVYEQDLVFLPPGGNAAAKADFRRFYDDGLKVDGERARPRLERFLFGFLDDTVSVTGAWSMDAFDAHCGARIAEAATGESVVAGAVLGARDPAAAARSFLVQCAGDFLTEASAMARNVLGGYGPVHSNLFKILIDEYGYGVHDVKHSTLFEALMRSVGLNDRPHHYWQFYLPTSLALINYFHYISRNHANFFRYIGAAYYTEATLAHTTGVMSRMLSDVFGEAVDTRYFDEHHHIDGHHGRMVRDELIVPLVDEHGPEILPEILQGFEAFALLQDRADADLVDQIRFADDLDGARRAAAEHIGAAAGRADPAADGGQVFDEPPGELSVTHSHPVAELFMVERGGLELRVSQDKALWMQAGDAVVIPAQRLHGSLVGPDGCRYRVQPLAEDRW